MFAYMLSPQVIEPEALDDLLAKGWFRMREHMFTTHFLQFNNQFYSAIWLRVNLQHAIAEKAFAALQKRNHFFRIEIKEATLDRRHEQLFAKYRSTIQFDTSDNLRQLLYGRADKTYFKTFEINLYDGDLLAAAGYFDTGKKSAAGIVSFYHPDYKKHSLGKYLIWCKLNWCQQQGLQYFYPGYTVPGYGMFDYKLSIGQSAMEYFSVGAQQWLAYTPEQFMTTPLQAMYQQLQALQQQLLQKGYRAKLLYYRYFDACLDPYFAGQPLLDFPVFLYCSYLRATQLHRLVIYNIVLARFQVLDCSTLYQMENQEGSHLVFNSDLLQVEEIVATAENPDELIELLKKE